MYSLATGIYQSYFAPPKLSILIIGIDGAGKTSLLERVKVTNINTRLVVSNNSFTGTSSDAPSTYVLPYSTRGCAVAGVNNNDPSNAGRDNDDTIQPQRIGTRQQKQQDGGKPARLPPPLPPKQAMKSSKVVEQMLDDGFSSFSTTTTSLSLKEDNNDIGTSATPVAQHLVMNNVPPPPLANVVESSSSSAEDTSNQSKSNKPLPVAAAAAAAAKNSKPPLPPRHNSTTDKQPLVKKQAVKKSSFIELFRCPSPKKYSDAALGDDDDEYDDTTTTANTNPSAAAAEAPRSNKGEGPWSTEYLQNYYINYNEDEEFDVMKAPRGSGGSHGSTKKMFPIDRIRPTLGQNLAKLDLCGCKCSLFDLSGAEKMRPLWERYYRDTDAIIYVVNAAETSITNLYQSRRDFEQMCNSDALQRRVRCGLPILIFANQIDVAYKEYETSMEKANDGERDGNNRCISWNADEEDDFVGGSPNNTAKDDYDDKEENGVSKRVVEFQDLATLFGFPQHSISPSINQQPGSMPVAHQGNVFLFGGSAKTGEGVRASIEYLVAHAKNYHLGRQARK